MKLQNPLFQKVKENFLPWEKVPLREVEGWVIVFMPTDHQPAAALDHVILQGGLALSCRIHINSGIFLMDSVTSPSAPRRMTGWKACRGK